MYLEKFKNCEKLFFPAVLGITADSNADAGKTTFLLFHHLENQILAHKFFILLGEIALG